MGLYNSGILSNRGERMVSSLRGTITDKKNNSKAAGRKKTGISRHEK